MPTAKASAVYTYYIYIYIHVHTEIYLHAHTSIYIYTHASIHAYMYIQSPSKAAAVAALGRARDELLKRLAEESSTHSDAACGRGS